MVCGCLSKRYDEMIRKGLLVSCLILVWGTHSLAQKVPDFSLDGKVFQTQLKAFFLQDNHPEIKPLMDQFEEMWVKNNLYSTSEQNKIINLAAMVWSNITIIINVTQAALLYKIL